MAVTWYNEQVDREMRQVFKQDGISSFKTFMAYTGAIGVDDAELIGIMDTAGDLGAMKSLEHRLGRTVERIHLAEYDYAGTSQTESRAAAAQASKSRSAGGMGTKSAKDLTPEELAALLNPGS